MRVFYWFVIKQHSGRRGFSCKFGPIWRKTYFRPKFLLLLKTKLSQIFQLPVLILSPLILTVYGFSNMIVKIQHWNTAIIAVELQYSVSLCQPPKPICRPKIWPNRFPRAQTKKRVTCLIIISVWFSVFIPP